MTFCYRKVKTRNKSLRSRADGIIRIKSTEIELEAPGIVMFRFRLGTITCNKEIHTICYQDVVGLWCTRSDHLSSPVRNRNRNRNPRFIYNRNHQV